MTFRRHYNSLTHLPHPLDTPLDIYKNQIAVFFLSLKSTAVVTSVGRRLCFKTATSNIDYGKTFFQTIIVYLFRFKNILCWHFFQYFILRLSIQIFHYNNNIICILSFIFQGGTAFLASPGKPPLKFCYSEIQFEIRTIHIRMQLYLCFKIN